MLVARCGWLANSASLCLISQSFAIFHRPSKIKRIQFAKGNKLCIAMKSLSYTSIIENLANFCRKFVENLFVKVDHSKPRFPNFRIVR